MSAITRAIDVYKRQLINRIESRNGLHTLEHAEEIGLGSRTYELVSVDL